MAILLILRNTYICLKCLLSQPDEVRTLLYPLQPLQRRQLPKGAQAFVADVVGAVASVEGWR